MFLKDYVKIIYNLKENDGATFKNYKAVTFKTGYQVATEGVETKDVKEAIKAVRMYGGNCGLWYSKGIYYIDKSYRVATKKEALQIGRKNNQISVLKWQDMSIIYC